MSDASPGIDHQLVSTPIRSEAGHALPFCETLRRVVPLLGRIPITRVNRVTPLDHVGVPVWAAVTPLARDLTVHNGKGQSDDAARASAIMEAIERTTAEQTPQRRVRRGSFAALEQAELPAIEPTRFGLPHWHRYAPDREISWLPAYDLIGRRGALVALDLAITIPCEGVSIGVETNGLASGNTHVEAIVHALYELIERDAETEASFFDRYAEPADRSVPPVRMIDVATLPAPALDLATRVLEAGLSLHVRDLKTAIGIPVFEAILVAPEFPGAAMSSTRMHFPGRGCDLSASRAITRAITEAAQSRAAYMQGARDTFEDAFQDLAVRDWTARRLSQIFRPERGMTFPVEDEAASDDLLLDLEHLLEKLVSAGFEQCLVVDLTRDDLGIPVVRVLVPGLSACLESRQPFPLRLLQRLV